MTGSDRHQLAPMAGKAKAAMGVEALDVVADRGYFSGEESWPAWPWASRPMCPSPLPQEPSQGRFGKQDFVYLPAQDTYRSPAGAWTCPALMESGLLVPCRYFERRLEGRGTDVAKP